MPLAAGWRLALRNRAFIGFAAAMTGSYILSFQIYLVLPLFVIGHGGGPGAIALVFAVSGITGVAGQLHITAWCRRRMSPSRALQAGVAVMAAAFIPPATIAGLGAAMTQGLAITAATISALLIALATAIAYPFEMDTLTRLARGRLVATHYGVYSTITGLGITVGTIGAGALSDLAAHLGHPALPWLALTALGLASATALTILAELPAGGRRPRRLPRERRAQRPHPRGRRKGDAHRHRYRRQTAAAALTR